MIAAFYSNNISGGLGWFCTLIYFLTWSIKAQELKKLSFILLNFNIYSKELENRLLKKLKKK